MSTTGIAVFAYDRPSHLKNVLEGLKQNEVNHLYIFSDGPETEEDTENVEAVRKVIEQVNWCSKTVVTRESNLGLAQSIVQGIDRVFRDHDRIIVLEDDCVPAANYVSFMRKCFDRYEQDSQVMNISGYSPPIDIPEEYPYDGFFTYRASSWGWGTWKSSWEVFEHEPFTLDYLNNHRADLKETMLISGHDMFPMMEDQLRGDIDSWAIWWGYAIATNQGVSLCPVHSKIRNIGHEGRGTHSNKNDKFEVCLDDTAISSMNLPDEPFVNEDIHRRHIEFAGGGKWYPLKHRTAKILRRIGLWGVYRSLIGS